MLSSRLARKRTSIASMSSSMFCVFRSIVGTTTSVRQCAGMPREKSMRGSTHGVVSSVAKRFTTDTASWLAASTPRAAMAPSIHSSTPAS
jgi:hypothetical protein